MDKSKLSELNHIGSVEKDVPKIYFCAHPEDRETYFDDVYKALSSKLECSLWYDGDPYAASDRSGRRFELEQMKLFVIPVTSRLLTSECRAVSEELPLARECGIPVLPLVIEKTNDESFDGQFASIFGNMQYLVFNQNDPTAISFDEKLGNYLSSVIVSPELSERIKNAFDGYIFLSYRKKDRKHVPPLMKAIHQSEELRDVAVWYDEFLTPGEDFSENIEKNLRKSNVFMLAVTPNLLEAGNYVMETEYPLAVNSGKPVVAVEVVKTNRDSLEKSFEQIPQCFPIENTGCISAKLRSSLPSGDREKKNSPEHKFLMGMAYFSGIDLEADKSRALDLLENSADAGCIEAMEQLSSFYRNGIGIRNTDARERQLRYVLHCKERYEREGTEKSALRFADALEAQGNLEDSLIRFGPMDPSMLGHHPVPKPSLLMIALLERTNEKYKTPKTRKKLIAAYDSICERYTVTRRNGMIIDYGLKAIAILEDMAKYNYDTGVYENISARYHSLSGEVLVDAESSLEYLQKALTFYNKAKGKDRSPETLKGYLGIFDSFALCLLHRSDDRYGEGKRVARNILALKEELLSKEDSRENKLKLCKKYLEYSDYTVDSPSGAKLFDASERLEFCERAAELMEELFEDDDPPSEEYYALSLKAKGIAAKAYDELQSNELAAQCYTQYVLTLENPPKNIRGSEYYERLKAVAYLDLAKIFTRMGFPGRAAKCALSAVRTGKLRLEEYDSIVAGCVERSDSDTLQKFTDNGFAHYAQLVSAKYGSGAPADENKADGFTALCRSAYELCVNDGKTKGALCFLQCGIDVCRSREEKSGGRQNTLSLIRMLLILGDFYLKLENEEAAMEIYLECFTKGAVINDDDLQINDLRLMARTSAILASFAEDKGDLGEAERYYTEALKKQYKIFLRNENKDEINAGMAPLVALYKKQGNKLYSFKKTLALTKRMKEWQEE